MMEALHGLVERAKELELLRGIEVGKSDRKIEISHFFFTDDTVIFCQPDEKMLMNLRCVLLCFQAVSGLNSNIQKSELVRIGDTRDEKQLVGVLGCKAVKLPFKYLGLLLEAKYKDSDT